MRQRGHGTIDHTADMGIHGWGCGVSEAFEEIALAMFELMAELDGLVGDRETTVSCEAADRKELLVEFLNAIITRVDIEDMAPVRVSIERLGERAGHWTLAARVLGTSRENAAGRFLSEVKAATYCGASVLERGEGRWEARCVVDL